MANIQRAHALKPHALGMIGVLIVEYLLGIFSTVYVSFPQGKNEGVLWKFAWQQVPVALHILFGFLLAIGTLGLLVRSIIVKDKTWISVGVIATISVIGAVMGGAFFISTQSDSYSFLMAVSFIIALLAYSWGVYAAK